MGDKIGHNCEYWASRFMDSLWTETTETWEDKHEDWRAVGSNPFKRRLESSKCDETKDQLLCIIEFPSKRLDIAIGDEFKLVKESYVILEADRGEDCGMIRGFTTRTEFEELLRKQGSAQSFRIKQIYRMATDKDLIQLASHRTLVSNALAQCKKHVETLKLPMEILNCEYQFDLNKITFFYKSAERIDFRDLVKDLYKIFKTRIWMCAIEKCKDRFLCGLIND